MLKNSLLLTLFVAFLATGMTGCYHATVVTGESPGSTVINKPFAVGWIYGLVPPSTVDAASECTSGVARVETQLSFVNGLVSGLTFGLFTPMSISVTCASAGSASLDFDSRQLVLNEDSDEDMVRSVFSEAADTAVELGQPVNVQFAP